MLACMVQASIAFFEQLAAEAAELAENLPDGAAIVIVVAARVAREEEHLADLLIRICLARTT